MAVKSRPAMRLKKLNESMTGHMTTWGCYWPEGLCKVTDRFKLTSEGNTDIPMQSRITAYWPDGSVKWSAHTADAHQLGNEIEVRVIEASDNFTATEEADSIVITFAGDKLQVDAGMLVIDIDKGDKGFLFQSVTYDRRVVLKNARPCLQTEERSNVKGVKHIRVIEHRPVINQIFIEEEGDIQCILRFEGHFTAPDGRTFMPFIIRLKVGLDSEALSFVHTFIYDGDEHRDYLKGLGIQFDMPMEGPVYNRHIKFIEEGRVWHESAAHLLSWKPRIPEGIYQKQMRGEVIRPDGDQKGLLDRIIPDMPHWSSFDFCQDYANHYQIKKKQAGDDLCWLDVSYGRRSEGAMAMGSEAGAVLFAQKDFWEKHPSGYTVKGLDQPVATSTVWLWSPSAEAMDFRHYADRGYNSVCYEGYDYLGATPYGIANTSEFSIRLCKSMIPDDHEMESFSNTVRNPCLYVGMPEYYHKHRAFGYWSLPQDTSETEMWLEKQLDLALDFYCDEVEQRGWYGMFNYGDFMHTYDAIRHQWRYDMGGYAWDNTELVPTLWLWYAFLRSGDEKAFHLAEKLTRHASDVDVYHLGKYKGLGSRHNVSHWGCPCKEARIAMAAHHRFYYYLTGDRRLEDIFHELKDNEQTFYEKDPLGDFYDSSQMTYASHARSGPDWSSLCSNWMTQWERFDDTKYRDKILQGIDDIKAAPLGLLSGPDYEFDPESVKLSYIGEVATGGTHLQICMGAPQIWMEMADLIRDDVWNRMMADYGRFYFMDRGVQVAESGGLIGDRQFTFPMMAGAMGAYGARYLEDKDTAKRVWRHLLSALILEGNRDGFKSQVYGGYGSGSQMKEIPWLSTNFVAQWCLNVIVSLDFIRESLPEDLDVFEKWVEGHENDAFRRA